MAWKPKSHASLLLWLVLSLHILSFMTAVYAKSGRPITDAEIRMKKDECYADVESGLWGPACKSSMIAKENCALQCLSPQCYELVYESDPLEEGEKDIIRSQEYKFCMYR
ncbi:Fimbrin [Bienertia sinuspersici]